MAIRTEEISTDITLELDEDEISLADFNAACEAFSGLVKEVTKSSVPDATAKAWTIKVYEGSAGLGLAARPSLVSLDAVEKISRNISEGIELLAKGVRPSAFSDKAIEFAKNLASTFKSHPLGPRIRIWSKNQSSIAVTRAVIEGAKKLLDAAYEEDGSIEGVLEKVDGHDKRQFVVYEIRDGRGIKCEVDADQLEEALGLWKRRIEVIGTVRYRRDGRPVSIKAKGLIPFPDSSAVPSLEEMRHLLAGS